MENPNLKTEEIIDMDIFASELAKADSFFYDADAPHAVSRGLAASPYTGNDALVMFIIGEQKNTDPSIVARLKELGKYLTAYARILTAYMDRSADKNPQVKGDLNLWLKALSNLPLMSPVSRRQDQYAETIQGVMIAGKLADQLLQIEGSDRSVESNGFVPYLRGQGEYLRAMLKPGRDYKNIILTVSLNTFNAGGDPVCRGRMGIYGTSFTPDSAKWTESCTSKEHVRVNAIYELGSADFDYQSLQQQDIKREVDRFIDSISKARIEDAPTYFSGVF